MSDRTIRHLYIVIVSLAALYGLLLFLQYRQTLPETPVPVGTAGLSRTADKLVISTGGEEATLDRRGERWFVGAKAVGSIKTDVLLRALDGLSIVRVVSRNPAGLKEYGLDDKVNSVKVYKNKKLLRAVYFGAMLSTDSYYVKANGGPAIYEAKGDLIFEVGQPASSWAQPERKLK